MLPHIVRNALTARHVRICLYYIAWHLTVTGNLSSLASCITPASNLAHPHPLNLSFTSERMPLLNDDVYNGCSHPNMYEFFNKIAHIVCFGQEMLLLVVKSYWLCLQLWEFTFFIDSVFYDIIFFCFIFSCMNLNNFRDLNVLKMHKVSMLSQNNPSLRCQTKHHSEFTLRLSPGCLS